MKAVVYHGLRDMRVDDVPDPELEDDSDVLLRVERTAICGSDLHLYRAEELPETFSVGSTVGHEFLGVVEDAGQGVQNVRKGDRVLVPCTIGCGQCPVCRAGTYSSCPVATAEGAHANVFGFGHYGGGQAEAVRVPFADTNTVKLPADVDHEACLLLTDILPTGYMGAAFAEVSPGDTVVVFGCGPVGTFAQQSAMLRGAATVFAVDLDVGRLRRARERGCVTINPSEQDVVGEVLEHTDGRGAHSAIEAVGSPDLISLAAEVTRAGGRVAVIGVLLSPFEIQWPLFFSKNLTVRTGLVNPQVFIPTLLPLIREGRLNPAEIISHRLSLAQASEGYEMFANHTDDVLKVVLTP